MNDLTPHYLLNRLAGWRMAHRCRVVLADHGHSLRLEALPGSQRPLVDVAGSFGGLAMAIGVALDSQNRVYILDGDSRTVKRFDPCLGQFVTLPCLGREGSNPRELSWRRIHAS